MKKLSQHGDFPADMIEAAKAELCGELDFAEHQEPLARNLDGRVSAGGFIDTHFDFDESRQEVAPLSEADIKKRLKALQTEYKRLRDAYPDDNEKAKKVRAQMTDYSRQLQRDVEAAQAGAAQYGVGQEPPMVNRTAAMDEIEANEPKHGKLRMDNQKFVDAYIAYQRGTASIEHTQSLMPAAKGK
jgi:hydroxypyruvate isomerase